MVFSLTSALHHVEYPELGEKIYNYYHITIDGDNKVTQVKQWATIVQKEGKKWKTINMKK